jgi:hypothetical protein
MLPRLHRSRHRLILKSQEIIEGGDLITLNLTGYVMMSLVSNYTARWTSHPLFENINYIPQMLRQYIPLYNIRRRVHHFVLVCQLRVDPAPGT